MASVYRGVSFKNWKRNKSFILTDVDLVKQDLLNNLFTNTGSRAGFRRYGTSIKTLLYEPFDQETIVLINDQVKGVISADPRVVLLSEDDYYMSPDYDKNTLLIAAKLYYIELDLSNVFDINLQFEG